MKLISTWRKLTSLDERHLHMVELLVKKILPGSPYWTTLINKGIFYDKRFIR